MKFNHIGRWLIIALCAVSLLSIYANAQPVTQEKSSAAIKEPDIWNSLPQDILFAAHFRSSDLVKFYDTHYAYLNNDMRKELDNSIRSLEKETSLRFKEDLLQGFNGQYTLVMLGNFSLAGDQMNELTALLQALTNALIIIHPSDYSIFEKTFTSLLSHIPEGSKAPKIQLPEVNETTSIPIPGAPIPINLSLFRDKNNTLYIGLDEALKKIQAVQHEEMPPLSSLLAFKNSFQYFNQKGKLISQFVINPSGLAPLIKYFMTQSKSGDPQMREFFDTFLKRMAQTSSFMAFQARTYEDVILTESNIPDVLYDLYFWMFVSSISDSASRSKQVQTKANMKTLSTLLEMYMAENGKYPPLKAHSTRGTVENILKPILEKAQGATTIPLTDGWDNPLIYEKIDDNTYILKSFGRDGKSGKCAEESATKSYDNDIIFSNGKFTCPLPATTK